MEASQLKPEDNGRKISCILGAAKTKVTDGEIYYCSKSKKFFILQDRFEGSIPAGIKFPYHGYKYSYQQSDFLHNIEFTEKHHELWI